MGPCSGQHASRPRGHSATRLGHRIDPGWRHDLGLPEVNDSAASRYDPRMPFPAVNRLVPMVHVADPEGSIRFYELLGFRVDNRLSHAGRTFWAMLQSGAAQIMLALADGPVVAEQQAILLYLYTPDVAGLRAHLLARGVADGGRFCGAPGPNGGRSVVFEITRPDYMPGGEIRVADPDGYVLLVGQLG